MICVCDNAVNMGLGGVGSIEKAFSVNIKSGNIRIMTTNKSKW